MRKQFRRALFIFRRDLRLEDNTGLIFALEKAEQVIPAFIFTPEQITHNSYRSDHCLKFMIESLQDLEKQLKEQKSRLYIFQGKPEEVVGKCIHTLRVDAVVVNRDYTPYSQQRDRKIIEVCKKGKIPFYSFDDALLHSPEEALKKEGKPYTLFTPYYRNASKQKVLPPKPNRQSNYFHGKIPFAKKSLLPKILPKKPVKNRWVGGRAEALKILKKLNAFYKYEKLKEYPAQECSTHLSAYLKFTVCSPREVYAAICDKLGAHHPLIRSLYWRDFFTHIAFFFPHVFKGAFHPQFDKIKWSYNHKIFRKWCEGKTGFPLVDAGMREMKQTGFMPNRVRMICASLLVKDLHIDWHWGEKYFAQNLIDYDPAVNNGNWQWVASTGCDAQPYFRIFSPWRQQMRFDHDCAYIKKWIPELRSLPTRTIHNWHEKKHHVLCPKYPPPLVSHDKEAKKALQAFRLAKSL